MGQIDPSNPKLSAQAGWKHCIICNFSSSGQISNMTGEYIKEKHHSDVKFQWWQEYDYYNSSQLA